MTTATAGAIRPRRSALPRDVAARLAASEYARFSAAVSELRPEEWSLPTACPAWDVREMVAHVLGMARMAASPLEQWRQMRAASARRPAGTPLIDSLTAVQVDRYAALGPAGLVSALERTGPRAAWARRRIPGFLRGRAMPEPEVVDGVPEPWTLGYVVETILTRDTWMHRSDLADATGRPMALTADHDGTIVVNVVAEWAGRHQRPFSLTLTGPAGGTWAGGDAGAAEVVELDAVEFCRIVSGRGTGEGLLAAHVPF